MEVSLETKILYLQQENDSFRRKIIAKENLKCKGEGKDGYPGIIQNLTEKIKQLEFENSSLKKQMNDLTIRCIDLQIK